MLATKHYPDYRLGYAKFECQDSGVSASGWNQDRQAAEQRYSAVDIAAVAAECSSVETIAAVAHPAVPEGENPDHTELAGGHTAAAVEGNVA